MNGLRVALATVGVVVAAAGLAMVVNPALAGAVPSSEQAIQLLGLLALLQGGRVLWHRYRSERRAGSVEQPPESPAVGSSPGADFDQLAAAAGEVSTGRTLRSRRNRLRRRLRRAIVAGLEHSEALDRAEAVEAIEAGTWTDDPEAAALFTDEVALDGSSAWLSLSGSGPGSLTNRANRAALAVAELAGVEADGAGGPGEVDPGESDGAERSRDDPAEWQRDVGPASEDEAPPEEQG